MPVWIVSEFRYSKMTEDGMQGPTPVVRLKKGVCLTQVSVKRESEWTTHPNERNSNILPY